MTEPYPYSCEQVCNCYSDHQKKLLVADCSDSGLLDFPLTIPSVLHLLNLSNNNITHIASKAFNSFKVFQMNLERNSLRSLPQSIEYVSSLTYLYLSHNSFVEFPSAVLNLSSLVSLDLAYNQIESLPASIWSMTSLTNLNVSHNNITFLPGTTQKMGTLKYFNLSYNLITNLPAELHTNSLMCLDLAYNQIEYLPASISHMTALTYFDVSHNQITSVSRTLESMTVFKEFRMSHNRFECTCEIGWLKDWIADNIKVIPDFHKTLCSMSSNRFVQIVKMNQTELGCIKTEYYIPASFYIGKLCIKNIKKEII